MKEIENFGGFNEIMSEMSDNDLTKLSRKTGKSKRELTDFYKNKGDEIDKRSVQEAYVIVEVNIDHQILNNPTKSIQIAQNFMRTVDEKVSQHRPDKTEVFEDELTPLSNGSIPFKKGAQFTAKYTFES